MGKPLLIDGETQTENRYLLKRIVECIAMQPSHAGMPTWVPVDELEPYPLEPIEEPAAPSAVASRS